MLSTPPKMLWQSILWLKREFPLDWLLKENMLKRATAWFFFFNVLHFLTLPKPFTWNMHAFSLSLPVSRCSVWACCAVFRVFYSAFNLKASFDGHDWRLRAKKKKKKKKNCCCLCPQPSGRVEKYSPPLLNICSTAVAKLSHSQSLSNLTAWYLFLKELCIVVSVSVYHVPYNNNVSALAFPSCI